jgi:hypothetical protein
MVRRFHTAWPRVAEIVEVVAPAGTGPVVTVKFAAVAPAGTVMLAGTFATGFVDPKVTTAPAPEGAGELNVMVPVEDWPAVTVLGFSVKEVAANTVGPQTFATPPPPQV